MLDILLAIKNNNVSKIPNYDTSYSEHLKKISKGFIRKGSYITQLNISLEDLLKGLCSIKINLVAFLRCTEWTIQLS